MGELFLVNRSVEKAKAIAEEIGKRWPIVKVKVGYPTGKVDLALNATSLGLKSGDPLPFDGKQFAVQQAAAVYDMVYRPAETTLLRAAKAAGCRVANGLGMLLYQGAKALEIWSGMPAPVEIMRRALEKNAYGLNRLTMRHPVLMRNKWRAPEFRFPVSHVYTDVSDARNWAAVPFHFWSVVFFTFGAIVGSFLNVCIHRLPLGQSIVSPPSHCPHCKYSIPWYLNVPLFTWLYLRGKCRNCGAPISIRYFLVELLTAMLFLLCWLAFGHESAGLALVYCLFLSGLIVATFVDFEHFIIPDEITVGGAVAGVVCSVLVPALHGQLTLPIAVQQSILGLIVGAALIYCILRLGKLLFGRQKIILPADTRIIFTETALHLPEGVVPYERSFLIAPRTRLSYRLVLLSWPIAVTRTCAFG